MQKIRFKIVDGFLFSLHQVARFGITIIFGNDKRDELLASGQLGFYTRIQKWFKNYRWGYLWSTGKPKAWEPKVSEHLAGLQGELFVDVGSSIGYYAALLAKNFDEIIAVEPETKSFSRLVKNTGIFENVTAVQVAISDEEGEALFYISPSLGWHTLTPRTGCKYTTTTIKTVTLKTLLEGRTASLVKVDTEGAELKILDGAPENVKAWLIEAHGEADAIEEKLKNMGYTVSWITDGHVYATLEGV